MGNNRFRAPARCPPYEEEETMPLALVTGGGSAIGEGITRCLAGSGWTVAVSDINLDLARQVAAAVGTQAQALGLDATDGRRVKETVRELTAAHGGIDALVNVAGGMRGLGIPKTDFVDMTPALWTRILDVNLQSVLHCTHAVLPAMIAARRGAIVSIAASRGLRGGPQASVYSAAKAAIIVFSQALAQEVGPLGIRVNTIAPGNAQARWKTSAESDSPLGRPTSGEDIGKAVAFLLSEDASHITGSCLDVSGGTTLH
jgi:NAD(P)-dependent dehydrogenase (short-subunit alcohol dehydrogenase family)